MLREHLEDALDDEEDADVILAELDTVVQAATELRDLARSILTPESADVSPRQP